MEKIMESIIDKARKSRKAIRCTRTTKKGQATTAEDFANAGRGGHSRRYRERHPHSHRTWKSCSFQNSLMPEASLPS